MNCQDLPVAAFVDGELTPAEERAVERHLEVCPDCRSLVADVRTVRAAAFTLNRREPPPDLFARVQSRLAVEASARASQMPWPNTRTAWAVWLGAAAVVVLATVAGLLPLLRDGRPAPAPSATQPLVDSVEADLRLAEAHYEKAIQGLEQIARSDTDELDPPLAAVLQKNLQVVDLAIDESRAALETQPGSTPAQDGLFDAMRAKVALLQQTVELINEMRKGNQAEAGRLMQDLSR
ncbi:MAG TPA: zf-HC2 domain-containing protein [Vicinamibacterales bacterium]|nr:zf-HC2 domain-containing protein [Vicinamibacterales bacterium]